MKSAAPMLLKIIARLRNNGVGRVELAVGSFGSNTHGIERREEQRHAIQEDEIRRGTSVVEDEDALGHVAENTDQDGNHIHVTAAAPRPRLTGIRRPLQLAGIGSKQEHGGIGWVRDHPDDLPLPR